MKWRIVIMMVFFFVFSTSLAFAQPNQNITPSQFNRNLESSPPAIITQVELDSQLQESNGKPICNTFLGSNICQPLHQYSGSNHTCNGFGIEQRSGPQWFDIFNTQNTTVNLQNVWIKSQNEQRLYGEDGPYSVITLTPYEKCTYAFFPIDEPLSLDQSNMSIEVQYKYGQKNYSVSTPYLSDSYNDTRTWQYDGSKWTFAEQNTVAVPEFPFAIPVLLIGVTSIIVFYRIKYTGFR